MGSIHLLIGDALRNIPFEVSYALKMIQINGQNGPTVRYVQRKTLQKQITKQSLFSRHFNQNSWQISQTMYNWLKSLGIKKKSRLERYAIRLLQV